MTNGSPGPLHFVTSGNPEGRTLVFLHGWPDDGSLWRHQVEALEKDHFCVVPTLPNFGDTESEAGGCDFPELVSRVHRLIEELGRGPVTLITHDWGAYIGYLLEKAHPNDIGTMIAMDIGGHVQPSSVREAIMFVGYQWTLVWLWLLGGLIPPLGTALTRGFASLLKVPQRQVAALRSRYNYPYFYFWRTNLLPWRRRQLLGRYRPGCSVCFIYGGAKPLMFHTERWLSIVEKGGGTNHCLADAEHWFMESHIEQTNKLIHDWLAATA